MYAGLPPVLLDNANSVFPFGWELAAFKMSDMFLNRAANETSNRSEERRVGKGVDLGGRRIIKKKKKKT